MSTEERIAELEEALKEVIHQVNYCNLFFSKAVTIPVRILNAATMAQEVLDKTEIINES